MTTPIAQETSSYLAALSHVIKLDKKISLIVCSSREEFLQTLSSEITLVPSEEAQILCPTVARISAARNVQITFTPSLKHFRGHLSFLATNPKAVVKEDINYLVVLGLPDLHLSNNDLNAQSLSRTLALAVEAGCAAESALMFFCPRRMLDSWEEDALQREGSVWDKRLPVLASSVRGGEERAWSGRSVMLRKVFGQWCRIMEKDI